jgi:hypothetical protein
MEVERRLLLLGRERIIERKHPHERVRSRRLLFVVAVAVMRNDYVTSLRQYEVFRNLLQFLIHRPIELGRVDLMRIVVGVDDVLFGETIAEGARSYS